MFIFSKRVNESRKIEVGKGREKEAEEEGNRREASKQGCQQVCVSESRLNSLIDNYIFW